MYTHTCMYIYIYIYTKAAMQHNAAQRVSGGWNTSTGSILFYSSLF